MDISASLTYSITKTGNLLRQVSAKRIKQAGIELTPEESVLMNQLWDRDNQQIAELKQWSIKEASTLTRQIDQLVRKGLVTRAHGEDDRRAVFISLTAEGKTLREGFATTGIDQLDSDMVNASEEQADELLRLLIAIQKKAQAELQSR